MSLWILVHSPSQSAGTFPKILASKFELRAVMLSEDSSDNQGVTATIKAVVRKMKATNLLKAS